MLVETDKNCDWVAFISYRFENAHMSIYFYVVHIIYFSWKLYMSPCCIHK
jgi:hypothetical protein